MTRTECLGSSPSIEGIKQVIRSFYCLDKDREVTLTPTGETWTITTHKPMVGVCVWFAKGRYRFGKAA